MWCCWDGGNPQEKWVAQEQATAHFARVFDICVGKGDLLPEGSPGRKFKGRAAYQGNKVKDQDGNSDIFQELQSRPFTAAAS